MPIAKLASDAHRYHRPYRTFPNARTAFRSWLQSVPFAPGEAVLLPAYIGWSAREGSGVFDPVTELGLPYRFYPVDRQLHIDLDQLRSLLRRGGVRVLVLIHYFGYPDPGYREAAAMAREQGVLVLEDEAHALYTDLVGGVTGRQGDAAIFSLHKMLPVASGGMLLVNGDSCHRPLPGEEAVALPWEYDLTAVARRRVSLADRWTQLLAPYGDLVSPLRPALEPGVVPQTYPTIIRRGSRDLLYQELNDAGFGVVTLYHTMIDRITIDDFPDSHKLARTILNLPVHQDLDPGQLDGAATLLVDTVRRLAPR